MEPDDFRACLISMGYDLVSAPNCVAGVPSVPLPYIVITYCIPLTFTCISFPPHHAHWG